MSRPPRYNSDTLRRLHAIGGADLALRHVELSGHGAYWYDTACGAWGVEGGPTLGNLALAARMAGANAAWTANSRSGTAGGDGSRFLFFNDGKTFWST